LPRVRCKGRGPSPRTKQRGERCSHYSALRSRCGLAPIAFSRTTWPAYVPAMPVATGERPQDRKLSVTSTTRNRDLNASAGAEDGSAPPGTRQDGAPHEQRDDRNGPACHLSEGDEPAQVSYSAFGVPRPRRLMDAALRFAQYAFIRRLTARRAARLIPCCRALARGTEAGMRPRLSPRAARAARITVISRSMRCFSASSWWSALRRGVVRFRAIGWASLNKGGKRRAETNRSPIP